MDLIDWFNLHTHSELNWRKPHSDPELVAWAICESMQENIHQAILQQAPLTKGMKVED